MGTRHLSCAVVDGEYKVAQYGQWDGYLEGQGLKIIKFLRKYLKKKDGFEIFKKKLQYIAIYTEQRLNEAFNVCGIKEEWITMAQAETLRENYPALSRETGGDIFELIYGGEVKETRLSLEFAKNSLWCEWAYVIDMDRKCLEIHGGFNQKPIGTANRFYSSVVSEEGYYPVKLLKIFTFEEILNKDFLKQYNKFVKNYNETEEE